MNNIQKAVLAALAQRALDKKPMEVYLFLSQVAGKIDKEDFSNITPGNYGVTDNFIKFQDAVDWYLISTIRCLNGSSPSFKKYLATFNWADFYFWMWTSFSFSESDRMLVLVAFGTTHPADFAIALGQDPSKFEGAL